MIVYHQKNLAAFAGNHAVYWSLSPHIVARYSITSAAPTFVISWATNANVVIQPGVHNA